MPASYPKPDDQKVTRHEPKFGWTDLPDKREGDPPALPAWRTATGRFLIRRENLEVA